MQDIDLDKLFNEDTPDQSGDGGQPSSQQKPTNALSGLAQTSRGSKPKPRPQQPQVKPKAIPNDSKQQTTGQDIKKKGSQKSSSGVSMSPEGRPILEHDTREPIEKKLDELNEILDINLTDEIERTTFTEATELPSVPEGSEVLKKKIEDEVAVEKQPKPAPQIGTPQPQQNIQQSVQAQNVQVSSNQNQPNMVPQQSIQNQQRVSSNQSNQNLQQNNLQPKQNNVTQQQVQRQGQQVNQIQQNQVNPTSQKPMRQNVPQVQQKKPFTGPPSPKWPQNNKQNQSVQVGSNVQQVNSQIDKQSTVSSSSEANQNLPNQPQRFSQSSGQGDIVQSNPSTQGRPEDGGFAKTQVPPQTPPPQPRNQ
ncbi:hypothetical protein GF362_01615 [Candidatus Dojkabacteria bacterium]|nr:hypothetical protein [Candidatus Dojkabacteria bacterium]